MSLYRANFPYCRDLSTVKLPKEGSDGIFLLGQKDRFISQASCVTLSKLFPKLRVEIVPNVNHFLQQNAPVSVNRTMKEFLGNPSKYSVEQLK